MTTANLIQASSELQRLASRSLRGRVVADASSNPVTSYALRRACQWESIASALTRLAYRRSGMRY